MRMQKQKKDLKQVVNKKRRWRTVLLALTLIFVVTGGFFCFFHDSSQAAGGIYIVNGYQETMDPGHTYELTTNSMQLELKTTGTAYDDPRYQVDWSIEDTQALGTIASIQQSTGNKMIANVFALSPGNVTVTVTVKDSMDGDKQLDSTTCNIYVKFAIDTSKDDSIYKKIYATDEERSLVLYADSPSVQLGLNFGNASDAQWTTDNEEILEISQDGGLLKPKGAGHTIVTATYTSETDPSTKYTAVLNVYVIPKVSKSSDGTGYTNNLRNQEFHSGDYLYTDTDFTNQSQAVRSKITWVVKQSDSSGNPVVLADSLGRTSSLISVTPTNMYSNELQITGTAGSYYIEFYTAGTYSGEGTGQKTTAYEPTVVEFTLIANINDKTVTLGPGDSYNLPRAFGMTEEDFLSCFRTVSWQYNGGTMPDTLATYNSTTAVLRVATTAQSDRKVVGTIPVNGSSSQKRKLALLMGIDVDAVPSSFVVTVDIQDQLRLSQTTMTLSVGSSAQLKVSYNGDYAPEDLTWETQDKNFVAVDGDGDIATVTGKKNTNGSTYIVTARLKKGDIELTAECLVIVEPTLSSFKLDPNTKEMEMFVGDSTTIRAVITQPITNAPLAWTCSTVNNAPFTVSAASDGKSAVITAVQTGQADLEVTNTVNGTKLTVRITVKSSIQTISLKHEDLEKAMYLAGYNMLNDVSYTPTNATDIDLLWTSSDTSVATVTEDGYVEFVNAGTTLITVRPVNNPNGIMATCLFTIKATADQIVLSTENVAMDVGQSQVVDVTYLPKNSTAQISWTTIGNEKDCIDLEYDEEKKILSITAKSPGETTINASSPQKVLGTIKVSVKQPSDNISLSPKALSLKSGQTAKVTAALTPATSTDTLVWSSTNTGVATVDPAGTVTAVKEGTAFIRVQAFNNQTMRATDLIQVSVQDGVKGISLESSSETIKVGETIELTPIFNPVTAYDKSMTWTSSDSGVAKVEADGESNAKVTGIKSGVALITGTAKDGGYTVSCVISVEAVQTEATTVTVTPKTKFLKVGKKFTVKATVANASNKKVKWSTSKKKVATVTKKGKVTGKKVGTSNIKATAKDGSGASASCKVRVVRQATKLKLNKYSAKLLVGNTLKLKAKLSPKKVTIKTVNWTSSDNSIATVSSTGRVLALAEGMVRITATTKDGSNKKATCLINVTQPVEATGVEVQNSSITLVKGRSVQSGIVAQPADTTTDIKYYSDNSAVASVDDHGKIKAKAVGQATIYGETANGKVGFVEVQVVDLNRKAISMRQYDTEQLRVNDIDTGVTWYSKNSTIATVSDSGLVTGRRKGSTTIYAVVNGVKLGCRVTIKKIK